MSYNTKNYTEQGGNNTVIGGQLELVKDSVLKFNNGCLVTVDADVKGVLAVGNNKYITAELLNNQVASTATTVSALKDDFNALLAKLKASNFMTADATGNGSSSGTLSNEPT